MALLSVENVSMQRDPVRRRWFRSDESGEKVLDDVTFSIDKGQCFSVVGEEESGKFRLAFAILRLAEVSSGRIVFDNINITLLPARKFRPVRKWMQAIFPDGFGQFAQGTTLDSFFREAVRAWHPKAGEDEIHGRIEQVMVDLDLPETLRYMFPVEMDAVERQLAAMARAMLPEPEFLLCHNPSQGLDAVEQAEVLNRLSDLREKRGLTVLLSTDDLAVAHHMSENLGVLHRGRLLETGATDQVVNRPAHDYTKRLVSCSL